MAKVGRVVVGCQADAARRGAAGCDTVLGGDAQPMVLIAEPKPLDVVIRLVGPPSIERTGHQFRRPRGRKAWALLAYIVIAERAVSRQQLAELLFTEADDPLAALRWSLAELRRSLGVSDALRGDPISSVIAGASFDLDALSSAAARSELLGMSGELLEGVRVDGCAAFESWLIVERSRVSAAIEARLRGAALDLLANGRAPEAVEYASRAVARNLFDEGAHELLVRCLTASGDEPAALQQVAVAEDVLRRELGVTPSTALRAAARSHVVHDVAAIGGSAEVQSLLEAGRAALLAGAADAGVDCLQRAVDKSPDVDAALHGRALLALGSALVHSVRGRDGEGSAILHEAVRVATLSGDRRSLATACRELGFVEVQAGRRPTATDWLVRAAQHAGDDASSAAILGVHGMSASDSGDYPQAVDMLRRSVDAAIRCEDRRQQAWSLSILGRAYLLRDERSQAALALDRSIELVQKERWLAFSPWPQALRAELDLREGGLRRDTGGIEQAWTLACQLGDPCWEAMTARVLGMVSARNGDHSRATTWHEVALRRCGSVTDQYQWVRAAVLDSMINLAVDAGDHDRAAGLIETLATLAARCEMREMLVLSHLHRARLGDADAMDAGRLLAHGIDNPALHRALDEVQIDGPR
jgi:DNA-binding SARP family transcriptional activator